MNVVLRKPMTLEAFLAWEERQELRYEFDGSQPDAMTGGTFTHAAIQRNLIMALGNRLRGKPCQALGSELKIAVAGSIRYPDGFVVCRRSPVTRPWLRIRSWCSKCSARVPPPRTVLSKTRSIEIQRRSSATSCWSRIPGGDYVRPRRRRLGWACGVRRCGTRPCRRSASSCRWPSCMRVCRSPRPKPRADRYRRIRRGASFPWIPQEVRRRGFMGSTSPGQAETDNDAAVVGRDPAAARRRGGSLKSLPQEPPRRTRRLPLPPVVHADPSLGAPW